MKKMKSFCIIGLGRFGQTLALTLSNKGHQVMVIDQNEEAVSLLSDAVTNAVIGNCTSETVLRDSGVPDYDCAVICISKNLDDSILTTIQLKDLGVKEVVVRAANDMHRRILEKVGADRIVMPERDMGEKLANMLSKSTDVMEYIEFSKDYSIIETRVPDSWIGKSLAELLIRSKYGVTVLAVKKGGSGAMNISPDVKQPFEENDSVSLMGSNTQLEKIYALFR